MVTCPSFYSYTLCSVGLAERGAPPDRAARTAATAAAVAANAVATAAVAAAAVASTPVTPASIRPHGSFGLHG